MKTSFFSVLAAIALASASVIIIDTDAHSLDINVGSQSADCREFCVDAGKQCRSRGLPRKICDVVRGQCAHECLDSDAFTLSSFSTEDKCVEKCVDESHKCRDAGTDENECRNKFITCKDKCEQGKNFGSFVGGAYSVENAEACVDGSCRDKCHATEHRCKQSGMPAWQCEGDLQKCYESCSAPPSQLVLEMYANKSCKENCHATEHRCRTSGMPVWQCKGDFEHCVEGC
ncbi:hypothetical protein PENSPDRAFT_654302 [Peniophora sp. CONT]|nr:hypothetical protein PENSPDRAFT_654302 [Peniophora sp. CONT]